MNRLERWLFYRAILRQLKRLQKEARKMNPLPKWFGWLSAIIAVIPAVYEAYQRGGWQAALLALITALGAGGALVSHSAVGTGGKPQ